MATKKKYEEVLKYTKRTYGLSKQEEIDRDEAYKLVSGKYPQAEELLETLGEILCERCVVTVSKIKAPVVPNEEK